MANEHIALQPRDRTVNWMVSDCFGVSWVGGRTVERHEEALVGELGVRAWVRLVPSGGS